MPLILSLTGTWLSDASNLSDGISLDAAPIADTPDDGGSVESFAAGRQRYLAVAGTKPALTTANRKG